MRPVNHHMLKDQITLSDANCRCKNRLFKLDTKWQDKGRFEKEKKTVTDNRYAHQNFVEPSQNKGARPQEHL